MEYQNKPNHNKSSWSFNATGAFKVLADFNTTLDDDRNIPVDFFG